MKRLFSIICITFILIGGKEVFATSKEYSIDSLDVDAIILNNGDVQVNEVMEYNFDGEFNGILRDLKTKGANDIVIEDVKIIDDLGNESVAKEGYDELNNTYEINKDSDKVQIKLFTKSKNERKKINIQYMIKGAAKKYEESSELYWNFYTVENVSEVKEGSLSVKLNETDFDLEKLKYEVFADGDISANNTEDIITVSFKNLTSLIGIKVDFQKDYLALVNETTIIEKKEESSSSTPAIILVTIGVVGSILGWILVAREKSRNKAIKEYRETYIFDNNPMVVRPPSDLPPALVSVLVGGTTVREEMINSTFLYLAKRGYYKIVDPKNDTKKRKKGIKDRDLMFKRVDKKITDEYSHLKIIIEWFEEYELNGKFTLKEIKRLMKNEEYAEEFIDNLKEWQNAVKKDAINMGFYIKIKNKKIIENSWYNEEIKWNRYKDYLLKDICDELIEDDGYIGDYFIYGNALKIKNEKIDDIIKISTKNNMRKENKVYGYSNVDYVYCSALFDNINSSANKTVHPPKNSSTNFGGSSGSADFSSGGDFSGGGGGGSDAF